MQSLWRNLWRDESGQGLVEYALIIALVAVGLIAILLVLRNSIGNVFNNAATQLNNAPTNPYPRPGRHTTAAVSLGTDKGTPARDPAA